MTNPILEEFKRLFPNEVLSSAQIRAANRADKKELVASNLEGRAKDLRKLFDKHLGEGVAGDSDIIKLLPLDTVVGDYGNMSLDWLLRPLGPQRAFELGRSSNDYWGNLYRKYLDREPDKEGLEWWENRIEQYFKESIK